MWTEKFEAHTRDVPEPTYEVLKDQNILLAISQAFEKAGIPKDTKYTPTWREGEIILNMETWGNIELKRDIDYTRKNGSIIVSLAGINSIRLQYSAIRKELLMQRTRASLDQLLNETISA